MRGVEPERVSSLCEASILLESLCARLAASRITAVELGRLKKVHRACEACHQEGDVDGYALENRRFHSAVIAATQNQDLADAVEFCRLRIAPYQRMPFRSFERRAASQENHRRAGKGRSGRSGAGDERASESRGNCHRRTSSERSIAYLRRATRPYAVGCFLSSPSDRSEAASGKVRSLVRRLGHWAIRL